MIVVDTSALMAILLNEAAADACSECLSEFDPIALSAGTYAEALLVAPRRGVGEELIELLEGLACEIAPVTEEEAVRVAAAYNRFGKGLHPAGLNLGDCFAYVLAKQHNCPLLFVGDDFAQTDVMVALPGVK